MGSFTLNVSMCVSQNTDTNCWMHEYNIG